MHSSLLSALLLLLGWTTLVAAGSFLSRSQVHFDAPGSTDASTSDPPHWTRLSFEGLHVNTPSYAAPRYLTLSTLAEAELDPATAILRFGPVEKRSWQDVSTHCGHLGGIEGCERSDLDSSVGKKPQCKAASATVDGRALFDPHTKGCEPLGQLWQQAYHDDDNGKERLLSFKAHVSVSYLNSSIKTGTYERDFWLAHLRRTKASWPIENDPFALQLVDQKLSNEPKWTGFEPNQVSSLMSDPYLPRETKPKSSDPLHGVWTTFARWNLGLSLRLPEPPEKNSSFSPLISVYAPVGGQVVYVKLYRRENAPSAVNDEQGWVISIRDEWGFVWSLFGISPYHQNVYIGQMLPQGYVIGRVSTRPVEPLPRDQDPPADPPEKPPGGDGNSKYPYRFRELRIAVSRPRREWKNWKDPFNEGWRWYDPHLLLPTAAKSPETSEQALEQSVPPLFNPSMIFFAEPSADAVEQRQAFASASLSQSPSEEITTLSGDVEVILGVQSFSQPDAGRGNQMVAQALDPVGIQKLEWAVKQVRGRGPTVSSSTDRCNVFDDEDWRLAFEHSRIPHDWLPPSVSPGLPVSELWKYVVPSFRTGNFPWTRKNYASQFDWKARYLFYPLTRTLLTSTPATNLSNPLGYWNTRLENPNGRIPGRGDFLLGVRAWDVQGASTCAVTKVLLDN